jgi:hypothetical protein
VVIWIFLPVLVFCAKKNLATLPTRSHSSKRQKREFLVMWRPDHTLMTKIVMDLFRSPHTLSFSPNYKLGTVSFSSAPRPPMTWPSYTCAYYACHSRKLNNVAELTDGGTPNGI